MTPMFTLDTVCVIDAQTRRVRTGQADELRALESLLDLAASNTIRLQLTAAYDRDYARYLDPNGRAQREAWLSSAPIAPTRAAGIFRLNVSLIGGPDVLAGDEDVLFDYALRRLLTVDLRPEAEGESHARTFSDIDHLTAHARSDAIAFVTCDEKTILVHRDGLAALNVVVVWPSEALSLLRAEYGIEIPATGPGE